MLAYLLSSRHVSLGPLELEHDWTVQRDAGTAVTIVDVGAVLAELGEVAQLPLPGAHLAVESDGRQLRPSLARTAHAAIGQLAAHQAVEAVEVLGDGALLALGGTLYGHVHPHSARQLCVPET